MCLMRKTLRWSTWPSACEYEVCSLEQEEKEEERTDEGRPEEAPAEISAKTVELNDPDRLVIVNFAENASYGY